MCVVHVGFRQSIFIDLFDVSVFAWSDRLLLLPPQKGNSFHSFHRTVQFSEKRNKLHDSVPITSYNFYGWSEGVLTQIPVKTSDCISCFTQFALVLLQFLSLCHM